MDAVEEIKSRLSVEDVVGDYMELKRSGRNLKGLSPFQAEKTPSFMVSPEKQIWHDFSSNKGGNMFSFIMEMEGVDFRGALEILARKAGVDLEVYGRSRSNGKQKKTLGEIVELATKYFQQNLVKNPGSLAYLSGKRRLSKETIINFRLGYAPLVDDGLVMALKKRGFNDADIVRAGVGVTRYRGLGDMFRGRIMVPLMDQMGQVIGFTARQLVDEPHSPKYINTPAGMLYDKSRHVFALSQAKEAIRAAGYVVVVEGNLDVISSHQASVRQCVATAGTAMTEHHLKTLSNFTDDIRLCFDSDKAGIAATERAIGLAQGLAIKLSIISIDAKDPDELILKDALRWQAAVTEPTYAMDWLIARYREQHNLATANGKKAFSDALIAAIHRLGDSVEQDHYLTRLAELTDVSMAAVRSKYSMASSGTATRLKKVKVDVGTIQADNFAYQDQLLGLLLMYPLTRRVFEALEDEPVFGSPERQYIFEFITTNPQVTVGEELPEDLQSVKDYVNIVLLKAEELYKSLDANARLLEANDLVRRLQKDYKKQKQSEISKAIKQAEEAGDEQRVSELLDAFNQLLKE